MHIYQRIINFRKNHRLVIENFSYLTILQLFNLFLPLLVYPYLIRVLGTEIYGIIIFAQTIVAYFSIFINLGFNISATKDIALNRENKEKISEIISSILMISSFTWVLSLIVLLGFTLYFPIFRENRLLFILAFGSCFNDFLFITSYFQGLQKMRYITLINTLTRSIYVILIFIFVRNPSDYLYVLSLNALLFLFNGLIALYIIFVRDAVKFEFQNVRTLKRYVQSTLPIFYFNLFGTVKSRSNEVFLGIASSYSNVTIYNLSSKIANFSTAVFANLSNAIYPNISISRDFKQGKKYLLLIAISSSFLFLLLVAFARPIILLLGGDSVIDSFNILYIVGGSIPLYSISTALGQIFLLPNGLKREFSIGTMVSTTIYICLAIIFFLLDRINIYSVSYILLISNLVSVVIRYYYCMKNKLL